LSALEQTRKTRKEIEKRNVISVSLKNVLFLVQVAFYA
jgi:hypothetical protein